ncbi:MAG: CRISPR-associated protein Cas4 [Candidatus Odinarchaeota archaeon]
MKTLYNTSTGKPITGTLVWYYFICKRELWLMAHEITPDEDFSSLEIGRAVHEIFYNRMFKEIQLEGVKIDLLKKNERVICEIKTTSKFIEAARFQLLYYLYRLKEYGAKFNGSILVPKERRRIRVFLDEKSEEKIVKILKEIRKILELDIPPQPVKIAYCRKCAYREFCWV